MKKEETLGFQQAFAGVDLPLLMVDWKTVIVLIWEIIN